MTLEEHTEEALKHVEWGDWSVKKNMQKLNGQFFGEIIILRGKIRRDYEVCIMYLWIFLDILLLRRCISHFEPSDSNI